MAFLDKLSKITKDLTDKTTDMIEIGKLQSKISSEQGKITECKTKIGDSIFIQASNENVFSDDVQELIQEIKAAQSRIDELNESIQNIKASTETVEPTPSVTEVKPNICPGCQSVVADNTKFCPSCGTKVTS